MRRFPRSRKNRGLCPWRPNWAVRPPLIRAAVVAAWLVLAGCSGARSSAVVGRWESFGYPNVPPDPPYFLEIRNNGEYSYSKVRGHGSWTLDGDLLTLDPYAGVGGETYTLERNPKLLLGKYTDGTCFKPAERAPEQTGGRRR